MNHIKSFAALAIGASLLVLAGCGEDEPAATNGAETGQVENEVDQTLDEAAEETGDALSRLREAAEDTAAEAGRLAGEARQAAEQALEDAGPTLDRARDIAGQIGQSVEEIAQRAREDLQSAATALEQRVQEETGGNIPDEPAGDPDALLGPAEELSADTRAAARASMADVGEDYVGAWAADAASCARIDREAVEMFAVITPTTMRRYESVCNIEPGATADGSTTVTASCMAEGETEERQISFDTSEPDRLSIVQGDAPGVEFVRCSLP